MIWTAIGIEVAKDISDPSFSAELVLWLTRSIYKTGSVISGASRSCLASFSASSLCSSSFYRSNASLAYSRAFTSAIFIASSRLLVKSWLIKSSLLRLSFSFMSSSIQNYKPVNIGECLPPILAACTLDRIHAQS